MDQMFLLDDLSNIGKIFIQNIIISRLYQRDSIVLAVASLSITVTLLDRGFTAHSWFKIFLDTINKSIYNIKKGIYCTKLIKQAKLIF